MKYSRVAGIHPAVKFEYLSFKQLQLQPQVMVNDTEININDSLYAPRLICSQKQKFQFRTMKLLLFGTFTPSPRNFRSGLRNFHTLECSFPGNFAVCYAASVSSHNHARRIKTCHIYITFISRKKRTKIR